MNISESHWLTGRNRRNREADGPGEISTLEAQGGVTGSQDRGKDGVLADWGDNGGSKDNGKARGKEKAGEAKGVEGQGTARDLEVCGGGRAMPDRG